MILDQPAFGLGAHTVSLGEALVGLAAIVLALLAAMAVGLWRASAARKEAARRSGELEYRLAEMAGQLRSFAEATAERDSHLAHRLDARLDQVSSRLGQNLTDTTQRTADSLSKLHERLAVIDTAQKNITELTTQMVGLQDVLSNKQARGAFGQARMEAIVRDGLPAGAYTFQATLSNNTRPDCVVDLPESGLKLVIDAKFPLEAFNALKAARDEGETRQAAQRLRRDVSVHIRDIAQKYLIAGETHDTAILFVPSESLYADLYETFEDLIQRAHRARVILASPNILMLVVQTLQAVFKDARMREQAGLIKSEVAAILADVERLNDRVTDLRKHFGQASQDIDRIAVSSDKIAKRGLRIEQMELKDASAPQDGDDGHEGGRSESPRLVAGR
ncbi:DNA recombination protein RmuC [Kaustia mangrovi]|uniref:DNA recombination protein RmuC homolog n=1 Tax=Kaustia mangrovi TaxID=2593653 RepID=A0A7S8HCV6_9HYPH|nr:DNA recombination protein RmuC [Kaustia mangrovi]QPC43844.1 DNA recombination protein RmuC [Kaustia mangrovi]